MKFQNMNLDALRRAANLLVGPQATEMLEKTYSAINEAQAEAYNAGWIEGYDIGSEDGFEDGFEDGEANAEERIDNAFDNGFMHGRAHAEEEADLAAELANLDANAFNGEYDASKVTDSGDQQPDFKYHPEGESWVQYFEGGLQGC